MATSKKGGTKKAKGGKGTPSAKKGGGKGSPSGKKGGGKKTGGK